MKRSTLKRGCAIEALEATVDLMTQGYHVAGGFRAVIVRSPTQMAAGWRDSFLASVQQAAVFSVEQYDVECVQAQKDGLKVFRGRVQGVEFFDRAHQENLHGVSVEDLPGNLGCLQFHHPTRDHGETYLHAEAFLQVQL